MKRNLAAAIALAFFGIVLLAQVSASHAQPLDERQPIQQQTISNSVYLPLITRNWPCVPKGTTAYGAVSDPVVHVGEIITVTVALVNDCNQWVGEPYFGARADPPDMLSPWHAERYGPITLLAIGQYEEITLTLQAVTPGVVTILGGASYETLNNQNPPAYYFDSVGFNPIVVRILP
ncbi:MAG TPA: hypothetical protein VMP08_18235 [Anaerolineae bacterium]|nr:hypothetical protein [Anaerolineae bacterium]